MAEQLPFSALPSGGEELYRALFDEMPIPIAIYRLDEPNNTILYVNRYAREVWMKREPVDLVGLSALQLIHPDEHAMVMETFEQMKNGNRIEWIEERLVGPDGQEANILASTTPLIYQGRLAVLVAVHDITDLKKAQAEVQRQAEALAAHEERERLGRELHDGLGQMLGYLNVQAQATQTLLMNGQTLAAQTNLQQMAQVAQDTYADLRNHILGLRTPAPVPDDLFKAVETSLQQFTALSGVPAALSLPQDAPSPAFTPAVETEVLRIVQEALANIRKHAGARKVDVLFSFTRDQAQVIIADDGVGFDPARLPDGGQHFGLSIMRERALQIGAQLELRSSPGKGTQVLLSVPRLHASAAAPSPDDLSVIQGIRALLVDDHPLFLDGLRNLLVTRGITVVGTAGDGIEALAQARALQPNIIVMDVEMPRCNGVEATRAIKAELPQVKIVMLTVSESEENLFAALRHGASGYLLKSLDANTFCCLLADVMRGEVPLPPGLAARMLSEFSQRSEAPLTRATDTELTPRQWNVLTLVAQGMQYKEVARTLNLSQTTIKFHMGQILDRLHLKTREQAVAYARRVRRDQISPAGQGGPVVATP